jgi:class 3 adenylate cyclase
MTDPASHDDPPVARSNSRLNLERRLDALIDFPERHPETLREIDDMFGQDRAVMVLDMSGFSRTTLQHGVVSFLLMIHQMKLLAAPCIRAARGLVLKAEADNLFALFDTADDAVQASLAIIPRLTAANMVLPDDRQLYVSIGIGFGHLLNVDDHDVFGDEVNLASKLGEDIADKAQILLTAGARARLRDSSIALREESVSISGLSLTYYRVMT